MNERQLRQYQSIAPTIKALRDSPDLSTKAGARDYIANGSQYDDVLFSKSFTRNVDRLFKEGLVTRDDKVTLAKFKASRAVELVNDQDKRQYFTPDNEYRPDLSPEAIYGLRQSAKQDFGKQIQQTREDEEEYLGKLKYTRDDVQRWNDQPYTFRDLQTGFEQLPDAGAGVISGMNKPIQAMIEGRQSGDPSLAYQQSNNPLIAAGEAFGTPFQERVASMPGTIFGGTLGFRGAGGLAAMLAPKKYKGAAYLMAGLVGAAGGGTLATDLNSNINDKAFELMLGSAALKAKEDYKGQLAADYPLMSRAGSLAGDLMFFAPSLKIPGVGLREAARQISQRGATKALKNTQVQATVSDIGDRSIEAAQGMFESYQQSEAAKAKGGFGLSPQEILFNGAIGALLGGETPLGKASFEFANKVTDPAYALNKLTELRQSRELGKPARPIESDITPYGADGLERLNLGGRYTPGVDSAGRPILAGAEYAVYDRANRKASIVEDMALPLEGRRSQYAAEQLQTMTALFQRQPVIAYSDRKSGVTRNIIGISRDAGVVVRDVTPDGRSKIMVVPVSAISNKKIAEKLVDTMSAQGVAPNERPSQFNPDNYDNADRYVYKQNIYLEEGLEPVPGRVIKAVGDPRQGMYIVGLPDGTHIRVNEGQINIDDTSGAKPEVLGNIRDEYFPTYLGELAPQERVGRMQWKFYDPDSNTADVIELTPEQNRAVSRARSAKSYLFDNARAITDKKSRDLAIEAARSEIAADVEEAMGFEPADGRFKRADVIDVMTAEFGQQTAIVTELTPRGYKVRLVDHPRKAAFVVQNGMVVADQLGNPITPAEAETMIGEDVDGDGRIGSVSAPTPAEGGVDTAVEPEMTPVESRATEDVDVIELTSATKGRVNSALRNLLESEDFTDMFPELGTSEPAVEPESPIVEDTTAVEGEPADETVVEGEPEILGSDVLPMRESVDTDDADTESTTEFTSARTFNVRTRYKHVYGTIDRNDNGTVSLQLRLQEFNPKGEVTGDYRTMYALRGNPDGSFNLYNSMSSPDATGTPDAVYTPATSLGRRDAINKAIQYSVAYATGQAVRDRTFVITAHLADSTADDAEKARKAAELADKAEARKREREEAEAKREAERERERQFRRELLDKQLEARRIQEEANRELRRQQIEVDRMKAAKTAELEAAKLAIDELTAKLAAEQTRASEQQQELRDELAKIRTELGEAAAAAAAARSEEARQIAEDLRKELLDQKAQYEAAIASLQRIIENGRPQTSTDLSSMQDLIEALTKAITDANERSANIAAASSISDAALAELTDKLNKSIEEAKRREEAYLAEIQAAKDELERLKRELEAARNNADDAGRSRGRSRRRVRERPMIDEAPSDVVNSRVIETVLLDIGGDVVEVEATPVANQRQLQTVLVEQYKFSSDGAYFFSGIVDNFARAWAVRQVEAGGRTVLGTHSDLMTSGRSGETVVEVTDEEGNLIDEMVYRTMFNTDPAVLKSIASYMRVFYKERLASFAFINDATKLDAEAKGFIFTRAKQTGMSTNVIVGLAARDQLTGIHEVVHALIRGMDSESRRKLVNQLSRAGINEVIDIDNLPAHIEEQLVAMMVADIQNGVAPRRIEEVLQKDGTKVRKQVAPAQGLGTVYQGTRRYLNSVIQTIVAKRPIRRGPDGTYTVRWSAPYTGARIFAGTGLRIDHNGKKQWVTAKKAMTPTQEEFDRFPGSRTRMGYVSVTDGTNVFDVPVSSVIEYGGLTNGMNANLMDTLSSFIGSYYFEHLKWLKASEPQMFEGFTEPGDDGLGDTGDDGTGDDGGGDGDGTGDDTGDDEDGTGDDEDGTGDDDTRDGVWMPRGATGILKYESNKPLTARDYDFPIFLIKSVNMSDATIEAYSDFAKSMGVPRENVFVFSNPPRLKDFGPLDPDQQIFSISGSNTAPIGYGVDFRRQIIEKNPRFGPGINVHTLGQLIRSQETKDAYTNFATAFADVNGELFDRVIKMRYAQPSTTSRVYDPLQSMSNIQNLAYIMKTAVDGASRDVTPEMLNDLEPVTVIRRMYRNEGFSGLVQLASFLHNSPSLRNSIKHPVLRKFLSNMSPVTDPGNTVQQTLLKMINTPDVFNTVPEYADDNAFNVRSTDVTRDQLVALYAPSLNDAHLNRFLEGLGDNKRRVEKFREPVKDMIQTFRKMSGFNEYINSTPGSRAALNKLDSLVTVGEVASALSMHKTIGEMSVVLSQKVVPDGDYSKLHRAYMQRLVASGIEANKAVANIWTLNTKEGRGSDFAYAPRSIDGDTFTYQRVKGSSDLPKGTVIVSRSGDAKLRKDDGTVVNLPVSNTVKALSVNSGIAIRDTKMPINRYVLTAAHLMEFGGEFNSVIPMSQFMFERVDSGDDIVAGDAFIQQPDILKQTKIGMTQLAKSDRLTIGTNGRVTAVRDYRGNSSHAFRMMTNVMGMSPNQAAAHYSRTESPDFKQWSGGNPLVESVYNADIRPDVTIGDVPASYLSSIRKYMSGQDALAILDEMVDSSVITEDDVESLSVAIDDFYRGEKKPKTIKQIVDFASKDSVKTASVKFAIQQDMKQSKYDVARTVLKDATAYKEAALRPRTGKPLVTIGFVPDTATSIWLRSSQGYILPSGVDRLTGQNKKMKYVRMDNPVVIDLNGGGMDAGTVSKLLVKHKNRDGIVFLNVKHSVGGDNALQNVAVPRNSYPALNVASWTKNDTASKVTRIAEPMTVMYERVDSTDDMAYDATPAPMPIRVDYSDMRGPTMPEKFIPVKKPEKYQVLGNIVDQFNDISRLVLSADFAFTTLQAGLILLTNPAVGIKALIAGFRGFFAPNMQLEFNGKTYGTRKFGREVFHKIGNELRAMDVYEEAREAQLPLTMFTIDERLRDAQELELYNLRRINPNATMDDVKTTLMDIDELGTNDEWFLKGRWTQHIPAQGMFERYNAIVHDMVLLLQFDHMKKAIMAHGYIPGSEKYNTALRDSARILAVSVGDIKYSTNSETDAKASRIFKVLFTAPRWLLSRALVDPIINNVLSSSSFGFLRNVMGQDNPVFDLYKGDKAAAAIGKKMWGRMAGAWLFLMFFSQLIADRLPEGTEVETNTDRNFGRIRVGDFRIDPPAGVFDHYRLAFRLAQAAWMVTPSEQKKAKEAGTTVMRDTFDDLHREFTYKASPLYNFISGTFFTGRTPIGEPMFGESESFSYVYDKFVKPRLIEINGGYKPWMDDVSVSNAFVERFPTAVATVLDTMSATDKFEGNTAAYTAASQMLNSFGLKVEIKPQKAIKERKQETNLYTAEETPNILDLLKGGKLGKAITGGTYDQ
jgi:hypothetical protein